MLILGGQAGQALFQEAKYTLNKREFPLVPERKETSSPSLFLEYFLVGIVNPFPVPLRSMQIF